MASPSGRLLRLLSVLSTRPSWTNRELAERLEVTERTVRRDVARLRDLGYGIESDAGPWGGYRLAAGSAMPPLNLDDDEALAVAVALREAALRAVLGSDQAALSALFKLQRLLPRRVADRLSQFAGAFVYTPQGTPDPVSATVLLELASACRHQQRLRLAYRDRDGRHTTREVDPFRLVRTANRWYLVALHVDRGEWRTFRADRVVEAHRTGAAARIADPPDAARLVADMLTSHYPVYATVVLPVPLAEAQWLIPPGSGVHEPDGDNTRVSLGGVDLDDLADRLLRLATPLTVLAPDDLRETLRRRVLAQLDAL
ncbi:helix-turn-helix transcriptional regulator [Kutzneria sp. CA-103260]|uniref:helix-turn-helix transcriptional regulator n=1 Tax=Kutzneria sp. CA-103260 TaxID=2802641 RepID=UPI001BA896B5|nr:WYL domain-containing protein [Kutzneria sp. CA-103260]QUQ65817.1 DeoR family transcriptional regulator [Kutzneria sp. CA-103260]